jgi:hypothetical protein
LYKARKVLYRFTELKHKQIFNKRLVINAKTNWLETSSFLIAKQRRK